jgi:catechol 2,3-dioxygenase-like lactoylglutathione lyase family enzyme
MESPIENRIGQVFVPVTDMARAVAWYSRLLGLPTGSPSHGEGIYNVPMVGETGLALDATKRKVTNSSQPLFFFWTRDIQAAHDFLRELGVAIVAGPENIGSVTFLVFRDPDRNPLMICQRNA